MLSRRKLLTGGLMALGGSAALAGGRTGAYFTDGTSASGDVGVAALDRAVYDYSTNRHGVQYQLEHRVTMSSGFDSLDITVRNASSGSVVETYTGRPKDGSVTFTRGSNQVGTTYEFEFAVNAVGSSSNPVLTETITDTADDTHPSDNDPISNPPVDPVLDQFTIIDNSTGSFGSRTLQYQVTWQASNTAGFNGFVRVRFRDILGSAPTGTATDQNVASGSVAYPQNGTTVTWAWFEITVNIVRNNGLVIDSGRDYDFANGSGSSTTTQSSMQAQPPGPGERQAILDGRTNGTGGNATGQGRPMTPHSGAPDPPA